MSGLDFVRIDRTADRPITRRPGFRSRERFDFGGHVRAEGRPFGALVAFNEDEVDDGVGIPMHSHAGVEVMTLMLAGRMLHIDSLGSAIELGSSSVKVMHTGDGLLHGGTCYGRTRFLQIWIAADPKSDRTPAVEAATFDPGSRRSRWQSIAAPQLSGESSSGPILLRQRAWVDRATFASDSSVDLPYRTSQAASFVYVVEGTATLGGIGLLRGDTVSFVGEHDPIVATSDLDVIAITQPAQEVAP